MHLIITSKIIKILTCFCSASLAEQFCLEMNFLPNIFVIEYIVISSVLCSTNVEYGVIYERNMLSFI